MVGVGGEGGDGRSGGRWSGKSVSGVRFMLYSGGTVSRVCTGMAAKGGCVCVCAFVYVYVCAGVSESAGVRERQRETGWGERERKPVRVVARGRM